MSGEEITMDDEIVQALQDSVLENEFVTRALDEYVRRLLGFGDDEDVTDSEHYWTEYSNKLRYYLLRMTIDMRTEYKYDEIVF